MGRCNEEQVDLYQRTRKPEIPEKIVTGNQGLLHAVLKRFSYFPILTKTCSRSLTWALLKLFSGMTGLKANFSSYATAIVDGEVRHHLRDSVLMRQPGWLEDREKKIEEHP